MTIKLPPLPSSVKVVPATVAEPENEAPKKVLPDSSLNMAFTLRPSSDPVDLTEAAALTRITAGTVVRPWAFSAHKVTRKSPGTRGAPLIESISPSSFRSNWRRPGGSPSTPEATDDGVAAIGWSRICPTQASMMPPPEG